MAVGAIEPKFYAELLLRLLELDEDPDDQLDRDRWPVLRRKLAEAFRRRSQAEWSKLFAGTDACVAPVVRLSEAPAHPHVAARGGVVEVDGERRPGRAPRFSGHPNALSSGAPAGQHTREVLEGAGLDADTLILHGVAYQT